MAIRKNISVVLLFVLCGCSVQKRIGNAAEREVINSTALQSAHVGISIYEPTTGRYLYNYGGDKYFVPASNVKLATCYAAMKYLGDSLVGLRYEYRTYDDFPFDTLVVIEPTGDPTFLHPDFKAQSVINFLKSTRRKIGFSMPLFGATTFGSGWAITDTSESYMPPLTFFPIYGNVARFAFRNGNLNSLPSYLIKKHQVRILEGIATIVEREFDKNKFTVWQERGIGPLNSFPKQISEREIDIPYYPERGEFPESYIADTVGKDFFLAYDPIIHLNHLDLMISPLTDEFVFSHKLRKSLTIHSQPTDSLLKPMMHRSDNFFAEQALLMVSNEHLGYMNDEKIIDTLLKTDFKDLPQKPRWADGSGLSRYNLFTPQDMVAILQKMKTEFGMPRIKNILATGGEGTLSNYFVKDSGFIYAKTGTLSGVVALSGFVYTKKGKELIFSVLVNNHQSSATVVRRAVEKFIQQVREKE